MPKPYPRNGASAQTQNGFRETVEDALRSNRPATDLSLASATALNRVVKTLKPSLKIGRLHHDEAEHDCHEQRLAKTIDRARAEEKNDDERSHYHCARSDDRATAGNSDADHERAPAANRSQFL